MITQKDDVSIHNILNYHYPREYIPAIILFRERTYSVLFLGLRLFLHAKLNKVACDCNFIS